MLSRFERHTLLRTVHVLCVREVSIKAAVKSFNYSSTAVPLGICIMLFIFHQTFASPA